MPNTYSQIYIQIVFAVQNRNALIKQSWEERLYKYITGIVQIKEQKMIAINGTGNHIHLFIGIKPNCSISNLVREIKKSSTVFINDNKLSIFKFNWQSGYGAFSYSQSHIDAVYRYIMNQKEHHKSKSFKEEYIEFLNKYDIPFDKNHLFEWIDG